MARLLYDPNATILFLFDPLLRPLVAAILRHSGVVVCFNDDAGCAFYDALSGMEVSMPILRRFPAGSGPSSAPRKVSRPHVFSASDAAVVT